ncbi:MAG: L,D-transpeptidase [Bdellovibrio sp.]
MKTLVLPFIFLTFMNINANAVETSKVALDDLMTPDEIAEEAGFPRTEYPDVVVTHENILESTSMNILMEYPIVVIVNKSASGYGAQTAQVYENGTLTNEWKVSTGREKWEVSKSGRFYLTTTPKGYFYPYTLIKDHWSQTWEANMEFSVFFNGGIAIHATVPANYEHLGTRASGGCVRLNRDNAQYLFERVSQVGKGLVPVIHKNGKVARDRRGRIIRAVKWKTLIVVEER